MMTVKELKEILSNIDEKTPVFIKSDLSRLDNDISDPKPSVYYEIHPALSIAWPFSEYKKILFL